MAEIEKLDGKTLDVVEQNIEQLKELFPSVFSEGKVQFNKLEELLGNYVAEDEDHYNFTWHGKRQAGRLAQTPSTGTLRPCKEESVDWDTTGNIFIEGDNLEVLKLLQKSYHRQVKMIYIDPPYNTGKEFIYPDKFQDNLATFLKYTSQVDADGYKFTTNTDSTGRYHTNWLNMMYPRLKLARNLLSDSGLIFISIDDHEQDNLKKLCNEIFGEDNLVNTLIWKKRYNAAKEKQLAIIHDYVLIYAKNINSINEFTVKGDQKYYDSHFKESDEFEQIRGKFMTQPLEAGNSMDERPNLRFPIPAPDGTEIWPRRQWVWGQERVTNAVEEGRLKFYKGKDGDWKVRHKQYAKDENGELKRVKPFTIYDKCYTQQGTKEIVEIFEDSSMFPFPKPTKFLEHLIDICNEDQGLYLDFFAGSASFGHAIYKANMDGGNRKFILTQLPEKCDSSSSAHKAGYENIADIGIERIRRAAKKIKDEKPDYNGDLGFKVFKLDSSNIKRWDADFDTLEQDLVDAADYLVEGRSDEDVLYELCLKLGLDLSVKIEEETVAGEKLFVLGRGYLVVCLSDNITMDLVNGIGDLKNELEPEDGMRVVFKDDGFKDDVVKTNALQTLKRFGITDIKSL